MSLNHDLMLWGGDSVGTLLSSAADGQDSVA
jgi:hypothetical protein